MKPFHAHHPAIGAGTSLLAGEDGSDCVLQRVSEPDACLGLFVGIRQSPALPWRMLPLFAAAPAGGAEPFEVLTPGRYGRTFAFASDRWLIGPLVFKLCTPWWVTASPDACDREMARLHFAPSIGGFVEYDNTHSEEPVEVIVGMGAPGAGFEVIAKDMIGFVAGGRVGFATALSADVRSRTGGAPFAEGLTSRGDYAALVFKIPAATKRVFPFAVGFFDPYDATQLHRSLFGSVEEVMASALANNSEVIRRADELDAAWFGSPGPWEEKVAHAHAVRSHLAASSVARKDSGWKLTRPKDSGLGSFDAEFFPWAGAGTAPNSEL
ncbi:MAG TPA: glycoside hydrolase family 52 protein [Opitutaceae bacterium]